jgi:hypothetical protein
MVARLPTAITTNDHNDNGDEDKNKNSNEDEWRQG